MGDLPARSHVFDPPRAKTAAALLIAVLILGARVVSTARIELRALASPAARADAREGLRSLLRFDSEPALRRRLGDRFAVYDALRRLVPPEGRVGVVSAAGDATATELARDCACLLYPREVSAVPEWEETWREMHPTLDHRTWVLVLDPGGVPSHEEELEVRERTDTYVLYRFRGSP